MIAIAAASKIPPQSVEARRPILSVKRKAGMDVTQRRIAETPDAKNDALAEDSPAS
jgi:hypothetical protein